MAIGSVIGRIAKATGKLAFMDEAFSREFEIAIKNARQTNRWKNIHKSVWDSFKKAEVATKDKPFFTNLWKDQILGFPKAISSAFKTKGLWNVTKALGGQLVKRLPLIFVMFELPNIFSAFKDKGLIGGCTEILKSGTRLAGGMAGFLVGQALIPIPFVGGLVGAFATDWLLGKVIGKSHTEQKEEALAKQQEAQNQYMNCINQLQSNPYLMAQNNNQQQLSPINIQPTVNPQQLMAMQQALYGGGMTSPMDQDFMAMTSGINRLGQKLNYMG